MAAAAIAVRRGCGTRVAGGVYAECGMGPGGNPLEDFLIDPPIIVEGWDIPNVGVKLFQDKRGTWHVLDRIGREHYPNVADFVEEVRRFGVSRRLPTNLAFDQLTSESRLLLVHDRAHVDEAHLYPITFCPKRQQIHAGRLEAGQCCVRFWLSDLDPASLRDEEEPNVLGAIERQMPSFTYVGAARPPEITPTYRPAIFGSFPLTRLVMVQGGRHDERTLERIRNASVPVEVENV